MHRGDHRAPDRPVGRGGGDLCAGGGDASDPAALSTPTASSCWPSSPCGSPRAGRARWSTRGRSVDSAATDVIAELLALSLLAPGPARRGQADPAGRSGPIRRDFFRLPAAHAARHDGGRPGRTGGGGRAVPPTCCRTGVRSAGPGTGSFAVGPVDTVLGDLSAMLGPADAGAGPLSYSRWRWPSGAAASHGYGRCRNDFRVVRRDAEPPMLTTPRRAIAVRLQVVAKYRLPRS